MASRLAAFGFKHLCTCMCANDKIFYALRRCVFGWANEFAWAVHSDNYNTATPFSYWHFENAPKLLHGKWIFVLLLNHDSVANLKLIEFESKEIYTIEHLWIDVQRNRLTQRLSNQHGHNRREIVYNLYLYWYVYGKAAWSVRCMCICTPQECGSGWESRYTIAEIASAIYHWYWHTYVCMSWTMEATYVGKRPIHLNNA